MRLNIGLGIRLYRCSLKRRMRQMRRMGCSPSFGVRYSTTGRLSVVAEVPVEQVWKESSSRRQR